MTRGSGPRALYALGAIAAGVVTAVFATVGDGVEVPGATGLRRVVVEIAHVAVWTLLSLAGATAAYQGRWSRAAGALASTAGVTYLIFLVAVFAGGPA